MDDEELVNVNFMDLDLNQEPTEPPLRSVARDGSLLNELETAHERIEERIRQLEGVTARARQRQRWRQARNPLETSYIPGEVTVNVGDSGVLDENNNMGIVEMTAERGRGCKRDSSHLVAAALARDSEVKKVDKESGGFYDCNICLDVAREPVLTCCGHLFCWPCFYQVSKIDSTSKECPVCKGEVSDNTVIPIYGNGDCEPVCETESGLKIPPRPKACRIESVRQQCVTQGVSHVPVAEALRRIRISIGAMASQTQQEEDGGGSLSFDTSHEGQNAGVAGGRRRRTHQVSRVLSESAASLSTLSSALRNAERLVEDLEAVITNRLLRNGARALPIDIGNLFTRPSAVTQSNNQPTDSATDINAALPIASSSQSTDVSGSVVHVPRVRTSSDVSLPVALSSSSFRRRSSMSWISDLDSRDSRESRRRRLN